jgi:hypothetical protein
MRPSLTFAFVFLLAARGIAGGGGSWIPTAGPSAHAPFDHHARSAVVFDDGQGPALYVGGFFDVAGSASAQYIARLDGSDWSPVGSGPGEHVYACAVFDDGSGDALYVGGHGFTNVTNVLRWDGSTWSTVGGDFEVTGAFVYDLAVFDDGTGEALYAGGDFWRIDGLSVRDVAKWDGTSWLPLSVGMNNDVNALAVFDDGTGPALYAGGEFNAAGGQAAPRVAKWDGTSWSSVGGGVNGIVVDLTVFDDGTGPALYAGGTFTFAGGQPANGIARWDGTVWSPLGSGVEGPAVSGSRVRTLAVYDDGNGEELFIGGRFTSAGGLPAQGMARWDGATWSALPERPGAVEPSELGSRIDALQVFDDGAGPGLFAVGVADVGEQTDPTGFAARFRDGAWSTPGLGLDGAACDVAAFSDDSGPAVCVVGKFHFAGGRRVDHVARWDGMTWTSMGGGFADATVVDAVEIFDGSVHVVGDFTTAGGVGIARWDGSGWSGLDGGDLGGTGAFGCALTTFDDGSGEALFVGGGFTTAGGVPANRIAKWDGASWSALGAGTSSTVHELVVFDDGNGAALYASGEFFSAGGVAARFIAKWDGTLWSPLANGLFVNRGPLAVFDAGDGPLLYAGGSVTGIDDQLVRWDGAGWAPAGFSGANGFVLSGFTYALGVFDDGTGDALYVGCRALAAPSPFVDGVVRYDGTTWEYVGGVEGVEGFELLVPIEDAAIGGPALFVGGSFRNAGGTHDAELSRFGRAVEHPMPYCYGDGTGDPCPCGNVGAPGHGCNIPAGTGGIKLTVQSWLPDFTGGGEVDLVGTGFPVMAQGLSQLIRSTAPQTPATVFGDGLLCVAPAGVVRISAVLSSNGVALNPAMHGAGAGTFYYQLWVRSQPIMFCDPNAAFNLSNGLELTWP